MTNVRAPKPKNDFAGVPRRGTVPSLGLEELASRFRLANLAAADPRPILLEFVSALAKSNRPSLASGTLIAENRTYYLVRDEFASHWTIPKANFRPVLAVQNTVRRRRSSN